MSVVKYERVGRLDKSANPQKLVIRSPIKVPVSIEVLKALAVNVERGGILRTSVDWTNIGTVSHAFDVISFIGEYIEAENTFYIEYGWILLDVTLAAGASTTSVLDGLIPDNAIGGLRDGMVMIAEYDPVTGSIAKVYAQFLTVGAINVTGIGAEVTGVTYAAL